MKHMTIGLIGDSTVAEQSGWGPAFARRVTPGTRVLNFAKNGATLDSLSARLDELLKAHPDYVLIQFGHNDQKRYGPDTYAEKLSGYVDRVRDAGSIPVILSSVTRRTFGEDGKIESRIARTDQFTFQAPLTDYAQAARDVARERDVPFIDLHAISVAHHNTIGPERSMKYNFKEGDKTHFNREGAEAIAALIIPELIQIEPALQTPQQ